MSPIVFPDNKRKACLICNSKTYKIHGTYQKIIYTITGIYQNTHTQKITGAICSCELVITITLL